MEEDVDGEGSGSLKVGGDEDGVGGSCVCVTVGTWVK